jgi:hypothetical protein
VEEDEERRSWVAKSNTSEEKANQKTRRKARVESEAIGMISLQTLRKIDGSRDKTCATEKESEKKEERKRKITYDCWDDLTNLTTYSSCARSHERHNSRSETH